MKNTEQAIEVLDYFNQIARKRFKPIKSNLSPIMARLKDYEKQELLEVIQLKTLEWKNNETMAPHLCPTTLFRPSNFDKYVNQLLDIKENPQKYAKHFAKLNKAKPDNSGDLAAMYGG